MLGRNFGIGAVYDDAETLLQDEKIDFVDIITDTSTHAPLVELAARFKIPVICQKPMAPDLETARAMVQSCRATQTPFFIHENWRWQTPLRALKGVLDCGEIGPVFRARIQFSTSFPVFRKLLLLSKANTVRSNCQPRYWPQIAVMY